VNRFTSGAGQVSRENVWTVWPIVIRFLPFPSRLQVAMFKMPLSRRQKPWAPSPTQ